MMYNAKRDIPCCRSWAQVAAHRTLLAACVVALALSCAFLLAGCKDSRAIKNIIHDQSAETVDYEGGETYRIVAADGSLIAEDTGLYEIGGKGVDSLPVNVLYVSSEPETDLPTSKFVYDEHSTNGSEASEGVSITPPDEEQQQDEQQQEDEQQPDERQNDQRRTDDGSGKNNAKPPEKDKQDKQDKQDEQDAQQEEDDEEQPGDDGENGDGQDPQENPGEDPENPSGETPSGSGDDANPKVYDGTGEEPELPDVGTIAAYGQVAVLVQMLGGTDAEGGYTPLVAADDELCAGAFSRVFSDEAIDRVNSQAFRSNGSGGYVPDIEQIVAADPDTVLVFSDGMFTDDEKKALEDNDISITVVPALTSDTGIMRAAKNIARILDESTDGRSTSNYELYKTYHDTIIEEVEGDRGYGAYDGVVYDAYMKSRPRTFSARKFTLVVDEWDYGASYDYRSAINDAGAGVGLATVGFRNSPVSYYLGVAGVVNNAAAIDTTTIGSGLLAPAWQFNPTDLSPSDIAFSSSAFASRLYTNWGTGLTKTTLSKVDTKKLTMRQDGFGTETFPVVIVATGKMRDNFIASANTTTGLYHPFGWATSDVGTIPGTVVGRTPVYTVIDESLDTSAGTKALVVNPHGLFSSWLEGSAESFLECAWAANIADFDNSWGGSVSAEIEAFYEVFYRYDIDDDEVRAILDGLSE